MIKSPHRSWLTFTNSAEAKSAQIEMAEKVILEDQMPASIKMIAGMDVSNNRFDPLKPHFPQKLYLGPFQHIN